MLRLFMGGLLILLVLSACAPNQSSAPTPTGTPAVDTALIERGIAVYRANYCGTCHTLEAANTRGIFGPDHNHAGTVAETRLQEPGYQGAATNAEEYLRESILEPERYLVSGFAGSIHKMPTYSHLETEDIDAMVYLLLQQRESTESQS